MLCDGVASGLTVPVSDGVTVTLELEDCVGLLDCEGVRVGDGVAERVGLGD